MDGLNENDICRERRESGRIVLDCYGRTFGIGHCESDQDLLAELLGDLLHACDLLGVSFVECLAKAAVEKRCEVLAELEDSFQRSAASPVRGESSTAP
jgi:hypothetical protein